MSAVQIAGQGAGGYAPCTLIVTVLAGRGGIGSAASLSFFWAGMGEGEEERRNKIKAVSRDPA